MKTRKLMLMGVLATLLTGSIAYAETAPAETPAAEAAATDGEEKTVILGEKTDTAYEATLVNATGRPVTEIRIKSDKDEDFSDNLLEKGDVFEVEETCILYCEKQDKDKNDLVYDIKIAFDETESYVIHEIPFKNLKDNTVKIMALDGVAYLEYTDAETGKEVNTKENEIAKRDEEAAKQETAAESTAAASDTAVYEESYSSSDYSDYSYEDEYDYSSDYEESYEESYEEEGGDECLADGLFW